MKYYIECYDYRPLFYNSSPKFNNMFGSDFYGWTDNKNAATLFQNYQDAFSCYLFLALHYLKHNDSDYSIKIKKKINYVLYFNWRNYYT